MTLGSGRPDASWRGIEALVHGANGARAGFASLLDCCGIAAGTAERARLESLPIEEDEQHLALWLLGLVERGSLADERDELCFRVVALEWHGRVDAYDLELEAAAPDAPRAGSAVLARLARVLAHEPERMERIVLGYAALAVQQLVERVDAALLLGGRSSRALSVDSGARRMSLGRVSEDGWTRAAAEHGSRPPRRRRPPRS